jgi:hypothetical protein
LRLLLVALVFAGVLPTAPVFDASATWSDTSSDARIVAPTAHATSPTATDSRSNVPHCATCVVVGAASSSATLVARARRVAAPRAEPEGVARWILGHATSTAIP